MDFVWHPGFAKTQAQKSIAFLHAAAEAQGIPGPILEISSKSPSDLGGQLSAFNLPIASDGENPITVEAAFQAAKVFEHGGPIRGLEGLSAREIRKLVYGEDKGRLLHFEYRGDRWPLHPATAFYDWLYLNALQSAVDLAGQLAVYAAFTDIAFNPKRSINCQARSAALYVALSRRGRVDDVLTDKESFLRAERAGMRVSAGSLF